MYPVSTRRPKTWACMRIGVLKAGLRGGTLLHFVWELRCWVLLVLLRQGLLLEYLEGSRAG